MRTNSRHSSLLFFAWLLLLCSLTQPLLHAAEETGLSNHGSDCNFSFPREAEVELTPIMEHIRVAWTNQTPTGYIKGGSGSALSMLEAGLDPAYGEAASPILSDGVLLVSWSQPSGEVSANLDSINHRYFRNADVNKRLKDSYFRIDADWHTIAIDVETGKTLWHRVEQSASINFLSNKRDHNGISGAARNGVYVTVSILGNVFAYDVKTGETKWTATLEEWHKRAIETKKEKLAKQEMPTLSSAPFGHKRTGAIIIDDTVILPDLMDGLVGLNIQDGSQRWHTADRIHDQATPLPWNFDGKTWLLCNNATGRGDRFIHLLDPVTGETKWSHATGYNPGQLLMGDDYLLLNTNQSGKKDALLTCYSINLDGLKELWAFEDVERNGIQIKADFGAHRKGVIRDGVLYAKLGCRKTGARMTSVDLATGKELHEVNDPSLGLNQGQPFIAEDKLYVQLNSAHAGSKAGLRVYQLEDNGRFQYLGDVMFGGLGISLATSYQYPIEMPYANGNLYMRGKTEIAAVDLTTVSTPMAEVKLENAWTGFHSPLSALFFADTDGIVQSGRLEPPLRKQLGIIGTSAIRFDTWMPLALPKDMKLGTALDVEAQLSIFSFTYPIKLVMQEAEGEQWNGTWIRQFPGWNKTVKRDGTVHESSEGGYTKRGWPTGWLKDKPVTFFSDLPDGQRRVFLQLRGITPEIPDKKKSQNMTICLDYNQDSVVAGIGGAFGFNQSYHEIDCSHLTVTKEGIKGTAVVILNPDSWVEGDYQNGGSLAGQLTLDLTFGEENEEGLFPVRGDWSVEWGLKMNRSGAIHATLKNMQQ